MQEFIVKPKRKVIIRRMLKAIVLLLFGLLCLFPVVVFWSPGSHVTIVQLALATIIVAPLGLVSIYLAIIVVLSILIKKITITDEGILVNSFFLIIKEKVKVRWDTIKEVVYRTEEPQTTYSIIRLEFKDDWGEIDLDDFDQEQRNLLREKITMKAEEKGITTSELTDKIDLDELYLEMEEEEEERFSRTKQKDERTTIE